MIDTEYAKRKDTFKYYDNKTLKEYLFKKNLSINYIPSDQNASCNTVLIIECYNDDLTNLIEGLKHVDNCKGENKEVLILVKNWREEFHAPLFQSWKEQFAIRGISKFYIKLEGFNSYRIFH